MKIKKITFQGWKNCIELTHGDFRLVVTTEVGPRIVGAFLGPKGENLLYLDKKLLGTSNQTVWTNYGGHRIWHAPEDSVRSYCPDSRKVIVAELRDGGVSFMAQREELTGIVKTINVYPEGDNSFRIEHQIRNEGLWDIEAAAWGITQLMPGGTAILPMNRGTEGLVPNRSVNFWPYAKPSDPRFIFGNDFVLVKQTAKGAPTKIGLNSGEGWCAYINKDTAFIKQFQYFDENEYPDLGSSIEVYTEGGYLELETLGPLAILEPGDEVTHCEYWTAAKIEPRELNNDEDVIRMLGLSEEDSCCDDDCCCHDHEEKKAAKKAAKAAKEADSKAAAKKGDAKKAESKKPAKASAKKAAKASAKKIANKAAKKTAKKAK